MGTSGSVDEQSLARRVVEQSNTSTFHPKYYRFQDAATVWMMTGSANLTAAGLESNIEVSVIVEDSTSSPLVREISKVENGLWNNPRAVVLTEERIGRYAAQSEAARKKMEAAEAELQREFEELPKLEGPQLMSELQAYQADVREQADLSKRKDNYQTALHLINSELLNEANPRKSSLTQCINASLAKAEATSCGIPAVFTEASRPCCSSGRRSWQ